MVSAVQLMCLSEFTTQWDSSAVVTLQDYHSLEILLKYLQLQSSSNYVRNIAVIYISYILSR